MQPDNHGSGGYLKGRKDSFIHAFRGIAHLIRQEPNARIHLIATIIVIITGVIKGITSIQWLAIVIAIGLVWITEAMNTAIEMLCNIWCDNKFHPMVKIIKDISAGAVLIAAIISVVIGVIVFLL